MIKAFSTKARTLEAIRGNLVSAEIPSSLYFSYDAWCSSKVEILKNCNLQFIGVKKFAVRSSSRLEDGEHFSNAGAFLTLLDVDTKNLKGAIDKVFESYGIKISPQDEALIQPMIENVYISGVAFSHDPNSCSPYRVINWSEGPITSAITSGLSGRTWQQAAESNYSGPKEILGVMTVLEELLEIFNNAPIDLEFAVSEDDGLKKFWLLQVRPLLLKNDSESISEQTRRLTCISKKIERSSKTHPFLMGKKTVFGVMPDWNPAEIIGVRPKPLAISLYRELITDSIWAYQRHNYGYRNLRSFPLMPHFFGLPYVDVRLSFNSFIPADLNDDLAARLVDYYIEKLLSEPNLHDKVEFEIVFSCYTFDLPQRLKALQKYGFTNDECETIANSLRKLSDKIINPNDGLWRSDAQKLNILESRRNKILNSDVDDLEKMYWLLEDGKRYGTLPFAGLARVGFIAIQILKSLVNCNILSESDYDAFMGGVSTVSSKLAVDRYDLDKVQFINEYGHLRPGTYDIESIRYDLGSELYFDWNALPSQKIEKKEFSLNLTQMRKIDQLLREHKLDVDPVNLFNFLQSGIELREFAKFEFTKNLSDILELIYKIGSEFGLNRSELSFSNIATFKELHVAALHQNETLRSSIEDGRRQYADTLRTSLPPVISDAIDIWGFEWPQSSPNFITQQTCFGKAVDHHDKFSLEGSIVCIPSADPGYDWLFSYPIAGLITAWGGVNSHMAIRAGELGIPSVIGAGDKLFRQWANAKKLRIDCANKRVEILE